MVLAEWLKLYLFYNPQNTYNCSPPCVIRLLDLTEDQKIKMRVVAQ